MLWRDGSAAPLSGQGVCCSGAWLVVLEAMQHCGVYAAVLASTWNAVTGQQLGDVNYYTTGQGHMRMIR